MSVPKNESGQILTSRFFIQKGPWMGGGSSEPGSLLLPGMGAAMCHASKAWIDSPFPSDFIPFRR